MNITIGIDGMMCSMCEAHVANALRSAFPNAKKVRASRRKKCAHLQLDHQVTEEDVRTALEPTGYTVTSVVVG